MMRRVSVTFGLLLMFTIPVFAADDSPRTEEGAESYDPLVAAFIKGRPVADIRYRFEWKQQDGFAEEAYANTLRTRLGYETGEFYDFRILVEFENVAVLGDDHFNSTTNGQVQFPVIADPQATEVNRAQLVYTGIPDTAVTLGRQRINLVNQRFVGAVDFRQNQQTFDAARLTAEPVNNLVVDYIYIDRVHRIFGDDNPLGEFNSDSHAVSLSADTGTFGKLTAYTFLLDLEEAPALSSATFGARYETNFTVRETLDLGAVAEFATQSDYAANPFSYREYYIHGEVAADWHGLGVKAGYEHLGGNGSIGFSTPLATLHKFQGFADVFLVTPADGIQDFYGGVTYAWKPELFGTAVKLFTVYHEFRTERDFLDLGYEVDAGVSITIRKHWSVQIEGAVFRGPATGPADRSLLWTSLRFRY